MWIKYEEEHAKMGWEEQVLFWLDTRLLQDVEYYREHAWIRGWRDISNITRYLMIFDIFWKIEGLEDA